ncbi:MAG TPA: sulfurtransferase, partial [Burkholderiales bacterium]|nr:sulfurtransferase [Burkholderiales bacterium]
MDEMTGLLAQCGLALVFTNVLLTQLGAPVPATPMLILAGAAAGNGQLAFGPALGLATLATLLGNIPWYFAGRRYGYPILRTLCRISIEPDSCVKRSEDVFGRWGALS